MKTNKSGFNIATANEHHKHLLKTNETRKAAALKMIIKIFDPSPECEAHAGFIVKQILEEKSNQSFKEKCINFSNDPTSEFNDDDMEFIEVMLGTEECKCD